MSVFDTTAAVVKVWASMPDLPIPSDRLELLWSAHGGVFYPDACRDLAKRVYAAFPGATSLKKDLKYQQVKDSAANIGGSIDTVDDLADAIVESLSAHEIVYLNPAARHNHVQTPKEEESRPPLAQSRKQSLRGFRFAGVVNLDATEWLDDVREE